MVFCPKCDQKLSRRLTGDFVCPNPKCDFDEGAEGTFENKLFSTTRKGKPVVEGDQPDNLFAKDGFRGILDTKTMFTVGEKGKKEHVTKKKKNNMDFDFMAGFKF